VSTWYTSPRYSNGHLARTSDRTYCGIPLNALVAFQPLHDGQCCFHCVPAAKRHGLDVAMPGYPMYENADREIVEPVDLDALARTHEDGARG
jgi:hypothetical protein